MPPTDRKPDAVLVPIAKADAIGKITLYAQLCAALGGRLYFGLDMHTGKKFGRLDPNETRLFPHGHPRQLEDRHDWFVARPVDGKWTAILPVEGLPGEDDEVWFGFHKDDPHAETPETRAAVADALEARIQDALLTAGKTEARREEEAAHA